MYILPFVKVSIDTELSKEEVLERFRSYVGPKRYERLKRVDKNIFSGAVDGDSFRLTLNIDHRNSWAPTIKGNLNSHQNGTRLTAQLRPMPVVLIFTLFFIMLGISLVSINLLNYEDWGGFSYSNVVFVVLPCVLTWFGFNLGAEKAIDGLLKITNGDLGNAR